VLVLKLALLCLFLAGASDRAAHFIYSKWAHSPHQAVARCVAGLLGGMALMFLALFFFLLWELR